MKNSNLLVLSMAAAVIFFGCSGGDDGDGDDNPPSVKTGYFLDSGVEGIQYNGGMGTSGITGPGGSFLYKDGESIHFSLHAVEFGSALGSSVVTPIDMVTKQASINIVRLLMGLDEDGDASNGITITTQTLEDSKSWSGLDFDVADLVFVSNVSSAGISTTLALEAAASAHLESTLKCAYSGAFAGSWNAVYHDPVEGDIPTNGSIAMIIESNGNVAGAGHEGNGDSTLDLSQGAVNILNKTFTLSGNVVDSPETGGGTSSFSSTYGELHTADTAGADFSVGGGSSTGHYELSRVGSLGNAVYRFTGFYYEGHVSGVYALDVAENGNVRGTAYDLEEKEMHPFTGTAINGALLLTIDDGTTVSGDIDLVNRSLTNVTWEDTADNSSGTMTGSGCKLN